MQITVQNDTKIRIAKSGPVRTFGDYDKRKQMTDEQLVEIFDHSWAAGLEQAVSSRSLPCDFEVARARLKGRQQEFLDIKTGATAVSSSGNGVYRPVDAFGGRR